MTKVLMLGSGELGKEVVIELKRLGAYVVAADRYDNAPAMQVADERIVLDMTNPTELLSAIERVRPDYIVPEIEAIATDALKPDTLQKMSECSGVNAPKVVPSYKAVSLTMNREGIRRLAAEELGLPTSKYRFAESLEELIAAAEAIGFPVVIKPVQSSSGKGQSTAKSAADLANSWQISQDEARGGGEGVQRIIVEGFVDFDYEITLLTCKSASGIVFCEPIGHIQVDGDYRISWQAHEMSDSALKSAQTVAKKVVQALTPDDGDYGIFGVELFIKGDEVIFSEVSPRPHDTGMVTMISQDKSEFAMHASAILGLPVYTPQLFGPSASYALLAHGNGVPVIDNVAAALTDAHNAGIKADIRTFGKPTVQGERRVGVVLTRTESLEKAKQVAERMAETLDIKCV